jgi:hypothetical protein
MSPAGASAPRRTSRRTGWRSASQKTKAPKAPPSLHCFRVCAPAAPEFRIEQQRALSSREAKKVRAAKRQLPTLWLKVLCHRANQRSHEPRLAVEILGASRIAAPVHMRDVSRCLLSLHAMRSRTPLLQPGVLRRRAKSADPKGAKRIRANAPRQEGSRGTAAALAPAASKKSNATGSRFAGRGP